MASNVVSDNFETSGGGVPQLGGTGATTCKAWVNFNGTGTVAIRDSYNVSSITDNGTGRYTVNFSTAMANANYTISTAVLPNTDISSQPAWLHIGSYNGYASDVTTTAVKVTAGNGAVSGSYSHFQLDCDAGFVQVFGD